MSESAYLFIIAAICLALIPIAPKMIALRIKMLRAIEWNSLAGWHQRNLIGFVLIARIVMAVAAVILVVLGFQRM